MQGLHTAESITGNGVDAIAGNGPGIIFTGVDHLRSPRGYMTAASAPTQPPLKCPRCDSTNTKFCYYNNYNLSQPRHFCKACRRYWTKGGVLRNVPVGGGCRKSKRASGSKSSKSSSNKSCKRTNVTRSASDTSTVTSVDPSNPEPGMIFADTCGAEPPSQVTVPSMGDLEFTLPDPINLHILNESKLEAIDKTKPVESSVLPAVYDHTAEADFLPAFQTQFTSDGVLTVPGLDWSLSTDSTLFDLTTSTVDTSSYWNQNHWGDAVPDPALYLP